MTDRSRALPHLLAALEALLRAGAELTAAARERSAQAKTGDDWLDRIGALLAGRGGGLPSELRAALASEARRWRALADRERDPAAERVLELFEALLDLLEPPPRAADEPPESGNRAATPRAPRRGARR